MWDIIKYNYGMYEAIMHFNYIEIYRRYEKLSTYNKILEMKLISVTYAYKY